MGGWMQVGPDSWKYSPDHGFGEQKTWPRHRWPSEYHKGKKIMSEETVMVTEAKKKAAQGRSNTGRLKVGTTIVFNKYPEKGPRQMMLILEKLEEFGKDGVTIGMFWEKLEGLLPTKQPVDRVYKHYHREMVDKEYIRIPS
jgi:hypothetical protein|tara:strand:+ start:364 stop:786 length:423 start_codon:yes stop_codon:yes gene_type:complete